MGRRWRARRPGVPEPRPCLLRSPNQHVRTESNHGDARAVAISKLWSDSLSFFFFLAGVPAGCACRLQHGVPDVLRRRRRQVQLPEQRAVRDVGRGGVLQPGGAPQLGRHPPHRGRLQADHRRLAQRRLLQPGHPPQLGGDHQDRPNPIKNTLFLSSLLNYLRLRCRRGKGVSIGNGGSMWHNNLYTCSSFLLCCNLSPVFNHK